MYSDLLTIDARRFVLPDMADRRKRVIKRSNGKTPDISNIILVGIFSAVVAFLPIALIIIDRGYRSGSLSIGIIVAIMGVMASVRGYIVVAEEYFVSVCEGCVYGRAVKRRYGLGLNVKYFDIGFDMITGVEKRKSLFSNIRIKCGADTYDCILNEPDEIIGLIKGKATHWGGM